MIESRNQILKALSKDISRRYISICRLQSDGRLELDKACLSILNPKDNEEFSIIDDNSSIIIVREPLDIHKNKVISKAVYKAARKRLVLPSSVLKILLCCKIGIKAFKYSNETALEFEPYIESPPDLISLNLSNIDELAPYVLRSSRSILHIDIFDRKQKINHSGTTFKILGEYWLNSWHQSVLDLDLNYIKCIKDNCKYCEQKSTYPLSKTIISYPVIAYEQGHYARPGLISFHTSIRNTSTTTIHIDLKIACKEWAKKCGTVEQYYKRGIIDYTGTQLFKIENNELGEILISEINDVQNSQITQEENGLMRLALKELMDTVTNYKP